MEVMQIPDSPITISDGDIIQLGRFSAERWKVGYGWYTWGGNRPFCGWYLTNVVTLQVKPIQLPDLYDVYIIETSNTIGV